MPIGWQFWNVIVMRLRQKPSNLYKTLSVKRDLFDLSQKMEQFDEDWYENKNECLC